MIQYFLTRLKKDLEARRGSSLDPLGLSSFYKQLLMTNIKLENKAIEDVISLPAVAVAVTRWT